MLKAGSLFTETGKTGCQITYRPVADVYILDADMIITDKLGVLYAPDGIAVHVDL